MKVWRGVLVGFGSIAERGHLPAWQRRADVEMAAVVDPEPARRERAAALLPAARRFADLPALFESGIALDFADAASPPAHHVPGCRALLDAGLHVLCEKPLATRAADVRALCALAHRRGLALVTVHNWKASPQYRRVRELVAAGAVGRVRRVRIEVERQGQSATAGPQWRRCARTAGGGILVDHGWHAFYLVLGLLPGPPALVRAAVARRLDPTAPVEDTAECVIEAQGATAEIRLTWAGTRRRNAWMVEGDRGRLLLDDDRLEVEGERRLQERFGEPLSAGSFHPEWFPEVAAGFLAAAASPQLAVPNQKEAHACAALLESAYASAAAGGRAVALEGIER